MYWEIFYYDGLTLRIYFSIEEGNKGDGYLTPIERDWRKVEGVHVVNEDTGNESDITDLLNQRAIQLFEETINNSHHETP